MEYAENLTAVKKTGAKNKIIMRVTVITLFFNAVLMIIKFIVAAIFHNLAIFSDGLHTASDFGTSLIVLIASLFAAGTATKKYNYGHEKIEIIASQMLGIILFCMGAWLGYEGVRAVISPQAAEFNWLLLAVAAISIFAKEAMYWYTVIYAKRVKSESLRAEAWHHRSDAFASIAVFVGLLCNIWIKTDIAQSISVVAVAVIICWTGISVYVRCVGHLMDKAADPKAVALFEKSILAVTGVCGIDSLKTRQFGSHVYIDAEISVNNKLSLVEAHKIAEDVHTTLERLKRESVKHITVHVNPESAHAEN